MQPTYNRLTLNLWNGLSDGINETSDKRFILWNQPNICKTVYLMESTKHL